MNGLATSSLPRSDVGVLASAATGLVEFIEQQGGDPDRILGHAAIDPEQLCNPTLSLDLLHYCRVFEEAARQTQLDNFGLVFGQQFRPESLGLLGYVGLCSATLGDALRNMADVFTCHQQGSLLQLVEQGDWCRLDYQVLHGRIPQRRQDAELSLGMFANVMRQALGPRWAPEQVLFEHARPEAWHQHCKAFDAPVLFGQPRNALVLRRSQLLTPMPGRDDRLLTVMLAAIRQLAVPHRHIDLLDQARHLLEEQLADGPPSLEYLAERLRLPSWTLQRRLGERGLTFSTLLDEVRRTRALFFLEQRGTSVSELALLLGYSETSAFSRAFRRWFGISPQQWRRTRDLAPG